ncbi:hypothetical protein Mapa_012050 [Marchantia paleacea]|nr:hypothetical protein Mapa_012050 [Marchantia paleacea]
MSEHWASKAGESLSKSCASMFENRGSSCKIATGAEGEARDKRPDLDRELETDNLAARLLLRDNPLPARPRRDLREQEHSADEVEARKGNDPAAALTLSTATTHCDWSAAALPTASIVPPRLISPSDQSFLSLVLVRFWSCTLTLSCARKQQHPEPPSTCLLPSILINRRSRTQQDMCDDQQAAPDAGLSTRTIRTALRRCSFSTYKQEREIRESKFGWQAALAAGESRIRSRGWREECHHYSGPSRTVCEEIEWQRQACANGRG